MLREIRSNSKMQEIKNVTMHRHEAESAIVRCVQDECFKEELKLLQSSLKSIRRSSPLFRLDPVNINGVICVGGRLNDAPYSSH